MYLGRAINLTNMEEEELKHRIAKAWAKFGAFRNELTDRSIPLHLRIRLFDTVVTPTALYACEAWTMTKRRQNQLRTAQRRMLRSILHAHRSYALYNDHVDWIRESTKRVERAMAEYGVKAWTTIQRERTWQWASKMAQKSGPRWTRDINAWYPADTRGRGRPKTRWSDAINAYLTKELGSSQTEDDWCMVASNINLWNSLAAGFVAATDLPSGNDDDE